jgi:hypothetical protein
MSPQVPPELQAEDEQELLLLLEPQEFLQGAAQLTQVQERAGSFLCSVSLGFLTRDGLGLLFGQKQQCGGWDDKPAWRCCPADARTLRVFARTWW